MNLASQAQTLIEPAFFWFVILGGTSLAVLAILWLIEFFSEQKILFTKASKKRNGKDAANDILE